MEEHKYRAYLPDEEILECDSFKQIFKAAVRVVKDAEYHNGWQQWREATIVNTETGKRICKIVGMVTGKDFPELQQDILCKDKKGKIHVLRSINYAA